MDDMVKKFMGEAKSVLAKPKNRNAALAAAGAYVLSKNNKERNALAAGLLVYLLVPEGESEEN